MTSDKIKMKNVNTSNEQLHVKPEPDVYLHYLDNCQTYRYWQMIMLMLMYLLVWSFCMQNMGVWFKSSGGSHRCLYFAISKLFIMYLRKPRNEKPRSGLRLQ